MNQLLRAEIEAKRGALVAVCEKYGVTSLDLFGSGTSEDWRPDGSDLDFVVAFHHQPEKSIADRYLGLAGELEALFGRPVDLLTTGAIRNPYFRRNVNEDRTPVYGE